MSLGGNVLLKWLGENPGQKMIAAAAAVSTPYDLGASGRFLETTLGRLYVGNFLATLKAKAVETARRFPEAAVKMDIPRALRAKSFWEFDDAANAPLHGFTGADDYYRRASSIGFVSQVATRALCLSAEDDPFLPPEALGAHARRRLADDRFPRHATWRPHRVRGRRRSVGAPILGRGVRARVAARRPCRGPGAEVVFPASMPTLAALLVSILAQAAAPAAATCPPHLFVLERTTNKNIVVYDARRLPSGALDPAKPVIAYWILQRREGAARGARRPSSGTAPTASTRVPRRSRTVTG